MEGTLEDTKKRYEEFQNMSREEQDKEIKRKIAENEEHLKHCPEALKLSREISMDDERWATMTDKQKEEWRQDIKAKGRKIKELVMKKHEKNKKAMLEMGEEIGVLIKAVKQKKLSENDMKIYKRSRARFEKMKGSYNPPGGV
jgi:hypothetical protein